MASTFEDEELDTNPWSEELTSHVGVIASELSPNLQDDDVEKRDNDNVWTEAVHTEEHDVEKLSDKDVNSGSEEDSGDIQHKIQVESDVVGPVLSPEWEESVINGAETDEINGSDKNGDDEKEKNHKENDDEENADEDNDDEDNDEEDNDDDFGSFEEQSVNTLELIFKKPLDELLNDILVKKGQRQSVPKFEYSDKSYSIITSPVRVYNKDKVQNNFNRMNYWNKRSAANSKLKEVIQHWNYLEEGVQQNDINSSGIGGGVKIASSKLNAIFNWTTNNEKITEHSQNSYVLENKSHQDQLMRIVMVEVDRMMAKEKMEQLRLQLEKDERLKKRRSKFLSRNSTPILTPSSGTNTEPVSPTESASASGSKSPNNKQLFNIGSFFKFKKKSSISKDHISSLALSKKEERKDGDTPEDKMGQPDVAQSSISPSLALHFEMSKNKTEISDAEDDEEDDGEVQELGFNYAYNNLHEFGDEESERESDGDARSETKDDDQAKGDENSVAHKPELVFAGQTSLNATDMSQIMSPVRQNEPAPDLNSDSDSDDEFNDFVRSPSPIEMLPQSPLAQSFAPLAPLAQPLTQPLAQPHDSSTATQSDLLIDL